MSFLITVIINYNYCMIDIRNPPAYGLSLRYQQGKELFEAFNLWWELSFCHHYSDGGISEKQQQVISLLLIYFTNARDSVISNQHM